MVQLMLDGLRGSSSAVEIHHVDARFSSDLDDLGSFRPQKAMRLLRYCCQAIYFKFRYGISTFYYVPAPPTVRNALVRDWIILLLCRPFFSRLILHWHAAGLGAWVDQQQNWLVRALTHFVLDEADVAIAPSDNTLPDSLSFDPRHAKVVWNGIRDPCPGFETSLLPARNSRLKVRQTQRAQDVQTVVNVLYLSMGCQEKGLLDSIRGVALANQRAKAVGSSCRYALTVAGTFRNSTEETLYHQTIDELGAADQVRYVGFAGGSDKAKLYAEADIFCFPTYYWAETLSLVVIEALAYGLPVVASTWRAIPQILPENYPTLVAPKDVPALASALERASQSDDFMTLRTRFLMNFTDIAHCKSLEKAFLLSET